MFFLKLYTFNIFKHIFGASANRKMNANSILEKINKLKTVKCWCIEEPSSEKKDF